MFRIEKFLFIWASEMSKESTLDIWFPLVRSERDVHLSILWFEFVINVP